MTTKSKPVDAEAQARMEALKALAHDQRVALVADAQDILMGLAMGLSRWQDAAWQFSPADMPSADGANWKRIPKLALLFAQLDAVRHTLDWQEASSMAPLWCPTCDGEYPGQPYLLNHCVDHDATPSSAASWLALWGAE